MVSVSACCLVLLRHFEFSHFPACALANCFVPPSEAFSPQTNHALTSSSGRPERRLSCIMCQILIWKKTSKPFAGRVLRADAVVLVAPARARSRGVESAPFLPCPSIHRRAGLTPHPARLAVNAACNLNLIACCVQEPSIETFEADKEVYLFTGGDLGSPLTPNAECR